MKKQSYSQIKALLTRKGISFRDGEEFSADKKGAIWTWAEGEHPDFFDYYSESSTFEFGIKSTLKDQLDQRGWFAEWYDCGTIFIYEI
jgi:hypothetical protein